MTKRCAIYTRKSDKEGLEQDFNSLDAQRFSCENYIKSQQHEGWQVIDTHYDDGDYSGGTLKRPALQRLFKDMEAGLIDVIIVYKMDRLSRSILDFLNLLETFNRHQVNFVTVTEHFNTTSSTGRLMLHMLLSFAQYEREIASERVRDKIAASKQKGLWMGGVPPLGYDLQQRALVVNHAEKKVVQHIFQRFVILTSIIALVHELNEQGYRTKRFVTRAGRSIGGQPFTKNTLRHLLTNAMYIGKIHHKKQWYEGQQEGIIEQALWDQVQATFRQAPKRHSIYSQAPTLLQGLIRCQSCDVAMTPTYTRKKQRHYRYYVCNNKQRGLTCPDGIPGYLAAGEVEGFVVQQVHYLLKSPEMIAATHHLLEQEGMSSEHIASTLQDIPNVWQDLFPAEQKAIIHALVRTVLISPEGIDVRIRHDSLQSLSLSLQGGDSS